MGFCLEIFLATEQPVKKKKKKAVTIESVKESIVFSALRHWMVYFKNLSKKPIKGELLFFKKVFVIAFIILKAVWKISPN